MGYICRDCLVDVGNGDAVLRSVSFQVVAYCRPCWEKHSDMVVPMPRRSADQAAEASGS